MHKICMDSILSSLAYLLYEPPHDKTTRMNVHAAKTHIILVICPSDQSSLCAQWVAKDPSFLHVDIDDWSDWVYAQTDLCCRWRICHFVGLSVGGSYVWLICGFTSQSTTRVMSR